MWGTLLTLYKFITLWHRRRINTEEKAQVVAAVWETEFIQFLAMLEGCPNFTLKKASLRSET